MSTRPAAETGNPSGCRPLVPVPAPEGRGRGPGAVGARAPRRRFQSPARPRPRRQRRGGGRAWTSRAAPVTCHGWTRGEWRPPVPRPSPSASTFRNLSGRPAPLLPSGPRGRAGAGGGRGPRPCGGRPVDRRARRVVPAARPCVAGVPGRPAPSRLWAPARPAPRGGGGARRPRVGPGRRRDGAAARPETGAPCSQTQEGRGAGRRIILLFIAPTRLTERSRDQGLSLSFFPGKQGRGFTTGTVLSLLVPADSPESGVRCAPLAGWSGRLSRSESLSDTRPTLPRPEKEVAGSSVAPRSPRGVGRGPELGCL